MKFTKMHGCGNDFVIVDGPADMTAARVRDLCDRRRGIGADGVLVIGEARGRCWRVTIHNADGSMGESCGNGARCVARYLLDRHGGEELELSFAGGDVVARREGTGIAIAFAPPPSPEPIAVDGVRGYRVSFGNPHVVLFVPDPANADLTALAVAARAALGDANVEVARVVAPDLILLRVDERGVGRRSPAAPARAPPWRPRCRTSLWPSASPCVCRVAICSSARDRACSSSPVPPSTSSRDRHPDRDRDTARAGLPRGRRDPALAARRRRFAR